MLWRRLPSHVLNGLSVALGIGIVQVVVELAAGPLDAQLASMGAICASLAHLGDRTARAARRVSAAALLASAASVVVLGLDGRVVAVSFAIGLVVFAARMLMAWGARAAQISFAPILAIIFSLALGGAGSFRTASWVALGAVVYVVWTVVAARVLEGRYRVLAVAAAASEMAALLRSRAAHVLAAPDEAPQAAWSWVDEEAALAARLQAARELLFPSVRTAHDRRLAAVLLHTIELRDVLLASQLDLELLGTDTVGSDLRRRLARGLVAVAEGVERARDAVRDGTVGSDPTAELAPCVKGMFHDLAIDEADPRTRLLPVLVNRLTHLTEDLARIFAVLRGQDEELPLTSEELASFVAEEGWPLAALRAHLTPASPVLRHAVRSGLALGGVYLLAYALPWAPHPYWLVLTVAVVLRETLDATLARRNARVIGTVIGCVVVVVLVAVTNAAVQRVVFPLAAGAAHAFVAVQYVLTAISATVMALLQAHLVAPHDGMPLVERLLDTVLGALLAWAFSYVWPSWERRTLPASVTSALDALRAYAVASVDPRADAALQRRRRRAAYDALASVAAAVKRSGVEPARVRPPTRELFTFVQRGNALMAHLTSIRLLLSRRRAPTGTPEAARAIEETTRAFERALASVTDGGASLAPAEPADLPAEPPERLALPWLLRRMQIAVVDATRAGDAARTALGKLGAT